MATWSIRTLERKNNRVAVIHWQVVGRRVHTGAFKLPADHPLKSVPFQNVTEAQCLMAVKRHLRQEREEYMANRAERTPRDNLRTKKRGVPW